MKYIKLTYNLWKIFVTKIKSNFYRQITDLHVKTSYIAVLKFLLVIKKSFYSKFCS